MIPELAPILERVRAEESVRALFVFAGGGFGSPPSTRRCVAGETPWARDTRALMQASACVARDVVAKLETLSDPPLCEPLRADLLSGRVRALVERMHL